MTPDISIIIATYNVQNYIERAILSALDQTGVSVEVIVVDDASTDDTAKMVKKIKDARVRLVALTRNGGPSVARNRAIELATGKWISVLDGDDALTEDRSARLIQLAEERKADIVVDNLRVVREADGLQYPMYRHEKFSEVRDISLADFIENNCAFLGGTALGYVKPVFSASFLKQHGLQYDVELRIGEDYIFLADALASGAVCVFDPTEGYRYTVRSSSISHRISVGDLERIDRADARFLSRHSLNAQATAAQAVRKRKIREAEAFVKLLDAMKAKQIRGAIAAVRSAPACLFQLWRPVMARVRAATT